MKQAIAGISGLKPRAPQPEGGGKLSREESHALDSEYRRQRNETLRLKNHREQMLEARARGELIEKRLVELQVASVILARGDAPASAGYPAGVLEPAGDGRRPHGGQNDP